MKARRLVPLMLVAALTLSLAGASEPPPPPDEDTQAASIELTEAQNRTRLREAKQMLPRAIPDEIHAMIDRESRRARGAIFIFLATCSVLFFLFVLTLFERGEAVVEQPDESDKAKAHSEA